MGILIFAGPTLGLLFGMRATSLKWWHPGTFLVGSAVVSLSEQSLTLPLIAHHFVSVLLLSPVVNVVAVPLTTLLVPLGFLAGLLGLVSLPLAAGLNTVVGPLAGVLIYLSDLASLRPKVLWGELEPVGISTSAWVCSRQRSWRRGGCGLSAGC